MSQIKKSPKAVLAYIVAFLFMLFLYSVIKWFSDYSFDLFEFIAFQVLTMYVLSLCSRLDGYWYIPKDSSLVISTKSFINQYSKVISLLGFLFGTVILTIYFEFQSRSKEIQFHSALENLSNLGLILFTACIYSVGFIFWNSNTRLFINNKKKVFYTIALTSFVVMLMGNILSKDIQNILVLFLILSSLFIPFCYFIREVKYTFMNKEAIIKKIGGELFFSEFLAADQSKKNAENLTIISSIFNNSSKSSADLLSYFSADLNSVFVKPDKYRKTIKSENFLDLKSNEDFRIFINNATEKAKDSNIVSDLYFLKSEYHSAKESYTEELMNVRTENIKLRNQNNLSIGFFIFILTIPFIFLYQKNIVDGLIIKFLMWMIFIRIVLRTFEIGRAFYFDLVESGYKNSFLISTDRIILAVKSVIEVCFLAASIYQLNTPILINEILKEDKNAVFHFYDMIWKTIEYSISVALFNVSFPEALIPQSNRNFIWLTTHLIQVISSVLLITVAINSYMSRDKNLVYFDFVTVEDKEFLIIKKVKGSFEKEKILINISFNSCKDKKVFIQEINNILNDKLFNNEISEKDYDHIVNMLKNQDYFIPV